MLAYCGRGWMCSCGCPVPIGHRMGAPSFLCKCLADSRCTTILLVCVVKHVPAFAPMYPEACLLPLRPGSFGRVAFSPAGELGDNRRRDCAPWNSWRDFGVPRFPSASLSTSRFGNTTTGSEAEHLGQGNYASPARFWSAFAEPPLERQAPWCLLAPIGMVGFSGVRGSWL